MSAGAVHRIVAGLGAFFLLCAAALHSVGYRGVVDALTGLPPDSIFRGALPGIWLFFSWHLVAFAVAVAWAALRGPTSARPLVVFAALVCVIDALFVFSLAGVFIGSVVLTLAAICLVTGAAKWPAT